MDNEIAKAPRKRAVKKTAVSASVPEPAPSKPAAERHRRRPGRGMAVLVLLVLGAVAFAVYEYRQTGSAVSAKDDALSKLAQVTSSAKDLAQKVSDLQALNELAAKTPPREILLKEYSSKNLSLMYPTDYEVVKATDGFPALTVKNGDIGRVEIFRVADFPGGKRDLPADVVATKIGSLTDEKVMPYDIWIYYGSSDENGKRDLDRIVASIEVVK